MIAVNGKKVDLAKFPDGTSAFRFDTASYTDYCSYDIDWKYEGDHECMLLWYLVNHIREHYDGNPCIHLVMPYIPNARMDRVKNDDEVFTLKWFAEFINCMKFDTVSVVDAHSNVSLALINRVNPCTVEAYVDEAVCRIGEDGLMFCYPDEGAAKRYSESIPGDYVFCIKHRRWRDGSIERLELTSPEKVAGKNVLIVDDICSRGGTFLYTAKALKEAGANKIYLYVTHCENTILEGEMLASGLIERVYTTDSLFSGEHEKIEVFNLWQ